jgi:hypothetical protein
VFNRIILRAAASRLRSIRSSGLALALSCAALLACAGTPAQAALLGGGTCSRGAVSQPFLAWGDANYYELVSGGNYEGSLAGWTLSSGARVVPGGEPYAATGALGSHSLSLPAGASAQSPFTCVNASYPSFRFFARNEALLASVLVQVVYKTVLGPTTASLGVVTLSPSWQPTLPMLTNSIVGGVLNGGSGQVALRFTALLGPSRIDDVFIDPHGY